MPNRNIVGNNNGVLFASSRTNAPTTKTVLHSIGRVHVDTARAPLYLLWLTHALRFTTAGGQLRGHLRARARVSTRINVARKQLRARIPLHKAWCVSSVCLHNNNHNNNNQEPQCERWKRAKIYPCARALVRVPNRWINGAYCTLRDVWTYYIYFVIMFICIGTAYKQVKAVCEHTRQIISILIASGGTVESGVNYQGENLI